MGKWHATDILEQDIRNKENNRLKSKMKRNTAGVLAGILLGTAFLGGCSNPVSTILEKPVFKVGKEICSREDARAILMNYQKEYSNLYGIDMWEHDYGQEQSLEDYIKDLTLAQMAQVYTLDVIASEKGVTLSEDEQKKVAEAAKTYLDGLEDTERDYIGLSEKKAKKLYERYVLAEKLYETLKKEVNQEVSDDEARVMKFKQIYTADAAKAQNYMAQLQAGADFVNDIWGLKYDEKIADVIAKHNVACCLMHNRDNTEYSNFLDDFMEDMRECIRLAKAAGIADDKIILDPGVGFGKTYEMNLEIIDKLEIMQKLNYPILLGTSRKSVIGLTLDLPVDQREEGTLVTTVYGVQKGSAFVRVHDVKKNKRAIQMAKALMRDHEV